MRTRCKKVLSLTLSLLLLLSAVPVFGAEAIEDFSEYTVPAGSGDADVMRASFTTKKVTVNGLMTEGNWLMLTEIGKEGTAGAMWDMSNLYLAVRDSQKGMPTVTLNGTVITADNATLKQSANKFNTEYAIALKTLGVTVKDYSTEITAKIQVGNNTWEGVIRLTSLTWYAADNDSYSAPSSGVWREGLRIVHAQSTPTGDQNVAKVTSGYNFYDRYSAKGRNPISIQTNLQFSGETYAFLGDRTSDTVVEFDFMAESMPVYKLGTDNDLYSYHSMSGFSWRITDSADNYVLMGIVNTDNGLVLVLYNFQMKDTGPIFSYALNKQLGDKFRVGTRWTTDGDVVLYVDGEIKEVIKNAECSHRTVTADNTLMFSCARSAKIAESDADNFEIFVTNIARGKYYGEDPIDAVNYKTILNKPEAAKDHLYVFADVTTAITDDLTLPATFNHPLLGKTLSLKWESSDSSVIDPASGKVTRPAENGKLVTLTATDTATGTKKTFDFYVKGLAPTSDVLVIQEDFAPQKGKGVVTDVHEYVFDTLNNSIIRDQKESKKVNVIALKDSDGINKLNETMLTVWYSDDNKTYYQVPTFKLLRDGMYTYLYDFEATGRYIKVHCTNYSTNDCDFIGPLNEMIEVYYEDVFGGGNSPFANASKVTLTNDTDTAKFDVTYKLSPEDAGVKCLLENSADVRFYLGSELLYHYFDGENFFVRVTKIPKNSSVTLKVLSGNAAAADISNKQNVHEIVYGTIETDLHPWARYATTLSDGRIIAFTGNSGGPDMPFNYMFSMDQGKSWSAQTVASNTDHWLPYVQGAIFDPDTNRIIVTGYRPDPDLGINQTRYVYTDDFGRTWKKAPITNEELAPDGLLSYCNLARVSSYDGDGPGVDFVHAACCNSDTASEYYDNGQRHAVTRILYSTDAGKSWTIAEQELIYYGGEADGIHAHIREHGTCENSILEAADGTVVVYMRCQYDNVYTLARATSKDHGITWSDVELSDVYSVNTQPYLFNQSGYQFMVWGGNNMFGQGSFRRYPLNIGVSFDSLMTFEGILDITSKTAFQGMLTTTRLDNTNPQLTMSSDTMLLTQSCSDRIGFTIRIDNFTDYFFKTRGAYDNFEETSAEWEGWAITGGEIRNSDAQASEGELSMLMEPGSSAVRSIPYLQNGVVSLDLYIEDVDKAKLEVELESSFGFEYGLGAPVAFSLVGNNATFFGAKNAVTLDLKDGWNHFEFDLALANDKPTATLSVNGGEAISMPVAAEIGNYICYVHVSCLGSLTYYLDEFLVVDEDNAFIPDIIKSANVSEPTEVPKSIDEAFFEVDEMIAGLTAIAQEGKAEGTTVNSVVYAVNPIISTDGGENWRDAKAQEVPLRGMTIKITYPEGSSPSEHSFEVLAVYEKNYKPVTKTLAYTKYEDGLEIRLIDTAPLLISWVEDENAANDIVPDIGGDIVDSDSEGGSSLLLYAGVGAIVVALAAAIVIVVTVTKKKSA